MVTLAPNLPQVNFTGAMNKTAYVKTDLLDSDSNSWALGLTLSIPLFSGLSSKHQRDVLTIQGGELETSRVQLLDTTTLSQVQTKENLDTEWTRNRLEQKGC